MSITYIAINKTEPRKFRRYNQNDLISIDYISSTTSLGVFLILFIIQTMLHFLLTMWIRQGPPTS